MDRPLDSTTIRTRRMSRIATVVPALAVIAVMGFTARAWLQPSVARNEIRTAVVERGPVEAATLCSGTVVPEAEQSLSCPFTSRIVAVLEQPGAMLEPGQALLELDAREIRLARDRLRDELELVANRRQELQIAADRRRSEINGRIEIQRERLLFLDTKTEQQRALRELGLTSIHELKQAELDQKIAAIELRQLEDSLEKEHAATTSQLHGLDIEASLNERSLAEQESLLERSILRADRRGVLTRIAADQGATVVQGTELARIADLSRFRVDAAASDLHADRFTVGMPVRVTVNRSTLSGHLSSILPAIEDGVMQLRIALDEADHPSLHANQRVDVNVITATRPDTLRVAKGPYVNGGGRQQVFVVDGDRAVRTAVTLGVSGIDSFEVLSGLGEGDTVIVSSMADYQHLEALNIR